MQQDDDATVWVEHVHVLGGELFLRLVALFGLRHLLLHRRNYIWREFFQGNSARHSLSSVLSVGIGTNLHVLFLCLVHQSN